MGTKETMEAAAVRGTNYKRNRSNNSATVAVVKKQRMEEGYCDADRESLIMLVRRDKGPVTAEIVDIIRKHLYGSIDSTPEGMARPKSNKLIDGVHVNDRWFRGPNFLRQPEQQWPQRTKITWIADRY